MEDHGSSSNRSDSAATSQLQPERRYLTFHAWCDEVDRLAAAEGCEKPYTLQTGRDCWRQQYDDDMTPAEVWADEKSYAAEGHDAGAQ